MISLMAKKKTKSDLPPADSGKAKVGRPSKGPRKAVNVMLPRRLRDIFERKINADGQSITAAVHFAVVEFLISRNIDVPPELRTPKTGDPSSSDDEAN